MAKKTSTQHLGRKTAATAASSSAKSRPASDNKSAHAKAGAKHGAAGPSAGARKAPAPTKTNKTLPAATSRPVPRTKSSPMTTRKPEADKAAPGKSVPAPAKGAARPSTAKPVPAKAGTNNKAPAGKAGDAARASEKLAARGAVAGAAKPAAKGGLKGAASGARPGARDESRTPASLARAAMKSAEQARAAAKPKKSPYAKGQLVPMRKALLEMRQRLIGDITLMEKEALRADDADVDVENVADHGTDAFERNMTLGLMEGEARTLRQIGESLDAMEAGRYGLCSACGEAIPLARLEALPFAQNCVPCQEVQERRL